MKNSLKKALIVLSIIGLLTYCQRQAQRAKFKKIEKFALFSPMQNAHKYLNIRIEIQATKFGSFLLYYNPLTEDTEEPLKLPFDELHTRTIGHLLYTTLVGKNMLAFNNGTELYNTIRIYSETVGKGLADFLISIFKEDLSQGMINFLRSQQS